MRFKQNKNLFAIAIFIGAILPFFALADSSACPSSLSAISGLFPTVQYCTATSLILAAIRLMMMIIGLIATLFVVWGGFQYITSAGNQEKAENGRRTLTNALIGLALAILAYVIISVVLNTIVSTTKTGTPVVPAANSGNSGSGSGTGATGSSGQNGSGSTSGSSGSSASSGSASGSGSGSGSGQSVAQECNIGQVNVSTSPSSIKYGDSFQLSANSNLLSTMPQDCQNPAILIVVTSQKTSTSGPLSDTGIANGVPVTISTTDPNVVPLFDCPKVSGTATCDPAVSSVEYDINVRYQVQGQEIGSGVGRLQVNY